MKRIGLSHEPCKGPSPALEHAPPNLEFFSTIGKFLKPIVLSGAPYRTRTDNIRITSAALYQLKLTEQIRCCAEIVNSHPIT